MRIGNLLKLLGNVALVQQGQGTVAARLPLLYGSAAQFSRKQTEQG
jgi:hypothetical protein